MMKRHEPACWEIFTDGASHGNPGPAGIGIVLQAPHGRSRLQLYKYLGETTNNVAEYTALIYALQEAMARGVRRVHVRLDSELVARQMAGLYRVRDATLRQLHAQCRQLATGFDDCRIESVPREQNHEADRLAARGVAARPDTSLKRVDVLTTSGGQSDRRPPDPSAGGKSGLQRAA